MPSKCPSSGLVFYWNNPLSKILQLLRLLFPLCPIGLTSCPIMSFHTFPKLWSLSTFDRAANPQHQLMTTVICLSLSLCNPTPQNSHLYKDISILCKWVGRNIRCSQWSSPPGNQPIPPLLTVGAFTTHYSKPKTTKPVQWAQTWPGSNSVCLQPCPWC